MPWVWAQGSQGPAKPQGALAQHSPTHPDSLALVDPKVGLASHLCHGAGTTEYLSPACPEGHIPSCDPHSQESLPRRVAWLVVPRAGTGAWGWLLLCQEEKGKQPCLRKRRVRCCWPAAFLGGQKPFVGKTGSKDFQDPAGRPPAGRSAQLPLILRSFCWPPAACLSIH